MKNRLFTQITLLLMLMFSISTIEPVKAGLSEGSSGVTSKQPRLIKTQGTNRYANVHCGLQDKAGNLWFGTTGEGVYRYDGKSFTNFTVKDGLSSNTVFSVLEDRAGNIWFGTDSGLSLYDGKTFAHIPISVAGGTDSYSVVPSGDGSHGKRSVNSIFQDKRGTLWFGTDGGVYCYDGASFSRFLTDERIINKDGLRLKMVQSILEDRAGNIWFASWFEGICRYDGKSITSFKPNDEVWFASIYEDRNGDIWAGRRSRGVVRFDGESFTNVLQKGIFDSCCVQRIIGDKLGNIWFATEFDDMTKREEMGGVWRYDGKSFTNYSTKEGLTHNGVFCIVEDRAGNLWFGTRNTGLVRYDGKTFTRFSE